MLDWSEHLGWASRGLLGWAREWASVRGGAGGEGQARESRAHRPQGVPAYPLKLHPASMHTCLHNLEARSCTPGAGTSHMACAPILIRHRNQAPAPCRHQRSLGLTVPGGSQAFERRRCCHEPGPCSQVGDRARFGVSLASPVHPRHMKPANLCAHTRAHTHALCARARLHSGMQSTDLPLNGPLELQRQHLPLSVVGGKAGLEQLHGGQYLHCLLRSELQALCDARPEGAVWRDGLACE